MSLCLSSCSSLSVSPALLPLSPFSLSLNPPPPSPPPSSLCLCFWHEPRRCQGAFLHQNFSRACVLYTLPCGGEGAKMCHLEIRCYSNHTSDAAGSNKFQSNWLAPAAIDRQRIKPRWGFSEGFIIMAISLISNTNVHVNQYGDVIQMWHRLRNVD